MKPLRGGKLILITKSWGIPDTHFVDLERWKADSTMKPLSGTHGLILQCLKHLLLLQSLTP